MTDSTLECDRDIPSIMGEFAPQLVDALADAPTQFVVFIENAALWPSVSVHNTLEEAERVVRKFAKAWLANDGVDVLPADEELLTVLSEHDVDVRIFITPPSPGSSYPTTSVFSF